MAPPRPVDKDKSVTATPKSPGREKIPERNLQSIYKNCLDLFQAKRINANNAFTCKLLDCLPQLIESPDFDIGNMQVVGRTLEMGTKIYVCRVEDTYEMVMGLAKRVGAKAKALEKFREMDEQRRQAQDDAENGDDGMELGDNELDENGRPLFAKGKKPREKRKRRGNFVTSKDKIRMTFPEKVEKYAERQARMRELFTKFKETRQPIPMEKFESRDGNDERAQPEDTGEMLSTVHKFPEAFLKSDLGSKIQFLHFVWLPRAVQFNPEVYDAWGRSKQALAAAAEQASQLAEAESQRAIGDANDLNPNAGGEYQFDANAEVEYVDERTGINAEHFGYEEDSDKGDDTVEPRLSDFCQVRSMSQLAEFYEALRTMGVQKKNAFSWTGSNFIKSRLGIPTRTATGRSEKRTRTKKVAVPLELTKIDFKNSKYKYDPIMPGKLELDDKCLERWKSIRRFTPRTVDSGDVYNEDTYLDILSMNSNTHPDVEKFLRYFVDPKWNILKLYENQMQKEGGEELDKSVVDDDVFANGDFDFDEGARSQFENGEEYCGKSFSEADAAAEPGEQIVLDGLTNLDSFLNVFPTITQTGNGEYEEFMGATADSEGIKFAKQPKPINMRNLKLTILRVLRNKLALDENNKATEDHDMTIDILTLLVEVFKRTDEKTSRFLSTSLLFLALLHVAAEIGVFLEKIPGAVENINIVAHGKGWDHRLHIPMPAIEYGETERGLSTGPISIVTLPARIPSVPKTRRIENPNNEDSEKENQMEVDIIPENTEPIKDTELLNVSMEI